jgi:hypothetical protein
LPEDHGPAGNRRAVCAFRGGEAPIRASAQPAAPTGDELYFAIVADRNGGERAGVFADGIKASQYIAEIGRILGM